MKRLSVDVRKSIARQTVRRLEHEFLCMQGRWNADKLLYEVEKELKRLRLEKQK